MGEEVSDTRNWQSVRTVLEALILAAMLWSARTQVTMLAQIAVLQTQVVALTTQLSDVPGVSARVSRLEVQAERNRQDIAEIREMRGLK